MKQRRSFSNFLFHPVFRTREKRATCTVVISDLSRRRGTFGGAHEWTRWTTVDTLGVPAFQEKSPVRACLLRPFRPLRSADRRPMTVQVEKEHHPNVVAR